MGTGPTTARASAAIDDDRTAFTAISVIAVVMLFAALLAPVNHSTILEAGDSIGDAARALVSPSDDLATRQLFDQIGAVGDGVVLTPDGTSLDGRFMLAGPVFTTDAAAQFTVVTSTFAGVELAATEPVLEGDRVIYAHENGVTEWWQQTGTSYEQGWTIDFAPVDGSGLISLGVEFAGAAPLADTATSVRLLLSDGTSAWYRDLKAFDANGTDLPATMTVDGSTVRIDVDATGATYPVTVDPIVDADEKILPLGDSFAGDNFGEVVATDGSLLAVSVRNADGVAADQGRVEIFSWNGSSWDFDDSVSSPVTGNTDFGWDLDLNGDLLAVGAPGEDTNGVDAGAVHLYTANGDGTWGFKQTIYECNTGDGPCGGTAAEGFDGNQFGSSVSVATGLKLVVGAPGVNADAGAAYGYDDDGAGGTWVTNSDLEIPNGNVVSGDRFGTSIAITDTPDETAVAIIGAPGTDVDGNTDNGRLYLSTLSDGVWNSGPSDDGSGGADGLEHGASVAIGISSDGDVVVIGGGPFRSRENPNDVGLGRVRVQRWNGESFSSVSLGDISAPSADSGFGFSVDFGNDVLVVGAPFAGGGAGFAEAYQYDAAANGFDGGGGTSALPLAPPSDAPTQSGDDNYGFSVVFAPTPEQIVAGSPGAEHSLFGGENAGRVSTFEPVAPTVITESQVSASLDADLHGFAVAVDGNRMAASAIGDDSAAVENGAISIYERSEVEEPWELVQVLPEPSPGNATRPHGFSLDLEGDYLVASSPGGTGQVTVYERREDGWFIRFTRGGVGGSTDFGHDVAITADGEFLFISEPGSDSTDCGNLNAGEVVVYRWGFDDEQFRYIFQEELCRNYDEGADVFYGTSIDADDVPGSSYVRLIAGSFNNDVAIDSWLFDRDSEADSFSFEASVNAPSAVASLGESVALDGNRLVGGSASGTDDLLIVAHIDDLFGEWVVQELSTDDLSNPASGPSNSFVDVDGDVVVAGLASGPGSVGIFYNNLTYGWGQPTVLRGWEKGPRDTLEPGGSAGDNIGRSVAVDGLTIVAGAPNDDTAGSDAGAVYSVEWTPPAPTVVANKLTGPTPGVDDEFNSDRFGSVISVDGNFAAIGAPGVSAIGVVYVYEFSGGVWNQIQTIDGGTFTEFGRALFLDGDRLAIASDADFFIYDRPTSADPFTIKATGTAEGAGITSIVMQGINVLVGRAGENALEHYFDEGNSFSQTGVSGPIDLDPGDQFGASMDIFGDKIAIGAPAWDSAGNDDSGKVYIYSISNGSIIDQIEAPSGGNTGRFGTSVALDNSVLVVGQINGIGPVFGGPGTAPTGLVHVFEETEAEGEFNGYDFLQTLSSEFSDTSGGFGSSVAIDGDVIVVGSHTAEKLDIPYRHGAAYSFVNDGTSYVESDYFLADDFAFGDFFGSAVGVDGLNVLVGARLDDNYHGQDAGAAYFYTATDAPVAPDNPTLTFSLDRAAGAPATVNVAPNGIAVSLFDSEVLEGASDDATGVVASSFAQIDVADSPLSGLPLSGLPLSGLILDDNTTVSQIPLVEIEIEGGWLDLFERSSSALSEVPLADLVLADVGNDAAAFGELSSTPLSGLNVRGTPLSGLPLSGLVLGGLTLDELSTDVDWCAILAGFVPDCDPASTTLIEASLSGVPLSGLPLSGLPLSGLDLGETPLSGLFVGDLNLAASPLSGLPLSGLPLSGLGLADIPLSGLPLSGLPLSGLELDDAPLSGLPLSGLSLEDAPLSGLPLSGLELRNVPLSGLPLSGLPAQSLPLSGLPLSGLALAGVPLSGLPLSGLGTDWCTVLADIDAGYDCSNAVDEATFLANTTIAELGVNGVPLSGLPLSGLPLSGLGLAGLPLSGLPLSGLPLSGLPLSGLPLSGLELVGTPLESAAGGVASLPLSGLPLSGLNVSGTALSEVPLSGLPLSGLPLSGLDISGTPLSGLPLSGLPLSGLPLSGLPLSGLPLSGLDVANTPLSGLPLSGLPLSGLGVDCSLVDCEVDSLGDAIANGAIDPTTVTIDDLQPFLSGIRLSDVADAILGVSRQDVIDSLIASGATLADLSDLDDLTLGDLPASIVQNILLGDLNASLWAVTYADLLGAIIDPVTGEPFSDSDVTNTLDAYIDGFSFGDFEFFGDVTFESLLQVDDLSGFTLADLGPILGLIHVTDLIDPADLSAGEGTVGDLTADPNITDLTLLDLFGIADLDTLTVGQLLAQADAVAALYGYAVADLLLALVGIDPVAFSGLDFTAVESGQLPPDLIPPVKFSASLTVADTENRKAVKVVTQIPATASYIPGTAILSVFADGVDDVPLEPIVGENTLTWNLTGVFPDIAYTISFDVKPSVSLGSSTLSSTATVVGTDASAVSFSSVEVAEGIEPNDFPATTPASEDVVYLTYIASETDNDVFSIDVLDNDQLAIQLSSLTVDLDFALYGQPSDPAVGAALTGVSDEAAIDPITDPDQTSADSEPLDDFRRLDDEDASLEFIGISNSPGTETELLVTAALPAGTYYIQVFGANGVTNIDPAALQVQILEADDRPACAVQGAVTGPTGVSPPLAGSTANTLILVNEQRMNAFYPGGWPALETEIDEFVAYLESPANAALGIDPIVVPVDGIGAVQSAYSTWDTDGSCSPESANAVVGSIIDNVIDPLRDTLEHVVVLGSDQVIPMARLLDPTSVANEYDFRYEFIGDNAIGGNTLDINALSASFWDRQYLSDEPYGESAARDLGNRFLYVSDIALGRMVETPTEIAAALQHFQTFDGALDADTAAVLGYDFLVDSSAQISADLAAAGYTVDDDLADGFVGAPGAGVKWDKDDAAGRVVPAGGAPDLISLNGHFDHYRALPADGDKVPNFNDNFLASTVANATPGLLSGSVVFSMGCHGGLSVSDLQINAGDDNNNGDWAQAFAGDQAIFIGNTGFGYGDTAAVAYTERLMALFAERAVRPIAGPVGSGTTTIGQALTFAKNDYASDLSVFSVYDEKALMESTFYGIPFYRVGAAPVAADPVPDNVTAPDSTGIETITVNADPENNAETTDRGVVYSNPDENGDPQVIVAPGEPIQPSQSFDVSVVAGADSKELAQVAHGALVTGMTSTYQSGVDPVVAQTVFNETTLPEPLVTSTVFPAKPTTVNRVTTPGGDRQNLVIATGRFRADGAVQRLDDDIDVVVYYSDPSNTDFTRPKIGIVRSTLADNALTVTLTASDDGSVERVYLLAAANPGSGTVVWNGFDLVQDPGTNEWSGSLVVPPTTSVVEFMVQAVDSSGNVGFATNKARNFNDDGTVVVTPPTPGFTVTPSNANLDPGSNWYTGPVQVTVETSGRQATYKVSPGGQSIPLPANGLFTVGGEGVKGYTVTLATGQKITGQVRIDSKNPIVTLAPPADGATYADDAVPAISFFCQDSSLVSCTASADGNPIANSAALPSSLGSHTASVIGTDVLGRSAQAMASYTVVPGQGGGDGPTIDKFDIDGVALPGEIVDMYAEFSGGVAPYTVTVDWGNDASCPGAGTCAVSAPSADDPGLVDAAYTYPEGGAYEVTVTVTDGNGDSGSATVTTATCTIVGTERSNRINGTNGDDVICGLGGNDRLDGRGGNDLIFGGTGNDRINGSSGDDILFGGRGNDRIAGGSGNDTMIGSDGNDRLTAGNGDDFMSGGEGNDDLRGGSGDDVIDGGADTDRCRGGSGTNTLVNCEREN